MVEQITDALKYNSETVKTVLNVLQKEFEAEQERDRFITSKVQMMLTLAGILLTTIAFLFKTIIENGWFTSLNKVLLFFAMTIIIMAIVLFLNVIKIKEFKRIKYESLVFNEELEKNPLDVESRLIATYDDALKGNVPVVDKMATVFKSGTILIIISILLIYAVLLTILKMTLTTSIGGKL